MSEHRLYQPARMYRLRELWAIRLYQPARMYRLRELWAIYYHLTEAFDRRLVGPARVAAAAAERERSVPILPWEVRESHRYARAVHLRVRLIAAWFGADEAEVADARRVVQSYRNLGADLLIGVDPALALALAAPEVRFEPASAGWSWSW